jgi:hypothetical protein
MGKEHAMSREEPLLALMDAERGARMDRAGVEAGWKRLDRAVHAGRRAVPVAITPLSLGFGLLSAKAAAAALALGVSSALATGVWLYERAPARSPAVETQTRAPGIRSRKPRVSREAARPMQTQPPGAGVVAASPVAPPSTRFKDLTDPRDARNAHEPSSAEADSSALVEEIRLIRSAKSELDRGNTARAGHWMTEHARRFPDGTLADEREALRLVLACSSAPGATSRAAALRYIRTFPRSLHRDRIARACELPAAEIPAARFETDSH